VGKREVAALFVFLAHLVFVPPSSTYDYQQLLGKKAI
jgi:hypothetical protein